MTTATFSKAAVRPADLPLQPEPPRLLAALTALRFPAAMMIVVGHSSGHFGFPAYMWQMSQAVSFFIVLSGFVLAYTYPEVPLAKVPRFYLNRFARIWPVHLLALILVLIVDPAPLDRLGEGKSPGVIFVNVLLLQNWIKGKGFLSINAAAWTLSTMVALYALFPLLIHKWRKTWHVKLVGAAGIVVFLMYLCNTTGFRDFAFKVGPYSINTLIYVHFLGRIFEFVLGMVAALAFVSLAQKWQPSFGIATAVEVTLLVLTILCVGVFSEWVGYRTLATPWLDAPVTTFIGMGGMTSPLFAALIVAFAMQRGALSRWMATPIPVRLGEISFALYLTHRMYLRYYYKHEQTFAALPTPILYLLFLVIALLTAHLVWQAVELPARAFLRGQWKHKDRFIAWDRWRSWLADWRWVMIGGQALVLAILVFTWSAMAGQKPANPGIEKVAAGQPRPETRDITFGDRFRLVYATTTDLPGGGLRLTLSWKAIGKQPLDQHLLVHLIDKPNARPLRTLDRSQDPDLGTKNDGETWTDTFEIPREKLIDVNVIALGLGTKNGILAIDKGPRDWRGKRLLINLQ